MKLNNKGLSIIELIVSIALISVIMLFLYRLLADVTFQKDNDYFASVNQEQRIEIIDRLEMVLSQSINSATLSKRVGKVATSGRNIYFRNSSNVNLYRLYVKSGDNTELILYEYQSSSWQIMNSWKIKGGTLDTSPSCINKTGAGKTLWECTIEVYTTNNDNRQITHNGKAVNNNNTLDDIVFSLMY